MMKIGAVINDKSGTLPPQQAEKQLIEIKDHLKAKVCHECLVVDSGDNTVNEIKKMIAKGIDVLVIGGGDGTISTAAKLVKDSDIILAVLGLGTRNHFARDLGIPKDPIEAIKLLDKLNVRQIDLGEVNGNIFINNATMGFYPQIVKERDDKTEKHGWRKWQAHIVAAFFVLWRFPKIRLIVQGENSRDHYYTPLLFVGNNEYQNGILSNSSRSTLNGGHLWVCTVHATGIWSLLRMAWQLTTKGIQGVQNIETRLVSSITVRPNKRKVTVAIDGENKKLHSPLRFNIIKKGLRVVVP
ncbi:MAG: diacylglycerol kinase family protein [Balneolales bacterium]